MGASGSSTRAYHERNGLRLPDGGATECMSCGAGFTCLSKKRHCQLCGASLCSDCCVQKRILSHRKPLVRACHGCSVQSRVVEDLACNHFKVWARVLSFLDEQSVNCTLQSCKPLQVSMPLPYKQVQKWSDLFDSATFLAAGAYGSVNKTYCRDVQKSIAVKTLQKRSVTSVRKWKNIVREIEIHSAMTHDNTIRMLGHRVVQTRTELYIMLELADQDLFDRIVSNGPMSEDVSRGLMFQLLSALHDMHSKGVVHRDIKPENILLTHRNGEMKLKIADFGFAKVYHQGLFSNATRGSGSGHADTPTGWKGATGVAARNAGHTGYGSFYSINGESSLRVKKYDPFHASPVNAQLVTSVGSSPYHRQPPSPHAGAEPFQATPGHAQPSPPMQFFTGDPAAQLADGLSKQRALSNNGLTACTPCGTYGFAAPELIESKNRGHGPDGSHALLKQQYLTGLDVFAAGVVLHIMLTGCEPFPSKCTSVHLKVVKRGLQGHHPVYSRLSREVMDMMSRMLCYEPSERPTVGTVLIDPWLKRRGNAASRPSPRQPTSRRISAHRPPQGTARRAGSSLPPPGALRQPPRRSRHLRCPRRGVLRKPAHPWPCRTVGGRTGRICPTSPCRSMAISCPM
eukprot:TRINITY_DN9277_c0_g1_i2.p1 TRINITY_DN9277_c0_g1~~TRINITY_DN9277_c0_g1_i2.p1  ORF type:complete len:627 (+),score=106.38 TRINITY_DN9277_c0_g1_i2:55-1935(+)